MPRSISGFLASLIGGKPMTAKRGSRANVAIIFAFAAAALVSIFAASVETTRVSAGRASLQAAVDAAALAAKRAQMENLMLGETPSRAAGSSAGEKMFAATKPPPSVGLTNATAVVTWDADGAARVTGTGKVELVFGGAVGKAYQNVSAVGVASAGSEAYLEVALLLDTTASMFNKDNRTTTRFSLMRTAAKDFVNGMFDSMGMPDRLRIAVVPWTTTVNIRSETPGTWDPTVGTIRTPVDAGSRVLPVTTINRDGAINQTATQRATDFAPVGWRGCISGNGESQTANDDLKAGMKWDALRVAPRVSNTTRTQNKLVNTTCQTCTGCTSNPGPTSPPPPPTPCGQPVCPQGNLNPTAPKTQFALFPFLGGGGTNVACTCVNNPCQKWQCPSGQPSITGLNCSQNSNYGTRNAFFNFTGTRQCVSGGCQSNLNYGTARGCVADPNEIAWNASGGQRCSWVPATNWDKFDAIVGPNLNCPMPMLGLSGDRSQVIDTIDRLSPAPGGTHADVGLRWGLRALSPKAEWAAFFGHAAPQAFAPTAKKIMVLITDGANEQAVNFAGYWGCSESGSPGCTGSPDRATLDARMLAWCTAIRTNHHVALYTVAINVSDAAAVSLLTQCTGDASRSFSVDATQLNATLGQIARETMKLRLKE
jgi:Flp pilus assembly protein TadG